MLKVLLQMMAAIKAMGHSAIGSFPCVNCAGNFPVWAVVQALGWGVAAPSLVAVATMGLRT